MTTQGELIKAFARFEESPTRASNMEIRFSEHGPRTAYLVGGEYAVYAKREPLSQVTVYPRWRRDYGYNSGLEIMPPAMQRQARRVRNYLLGRFNEDWNDRHEYQIVLRESDHKPTVNDFDDI